MTNYNTLTRIIVHFFNNCLWKDKIQFSIYSVDILNWLVYMTMLF